MELLLKWELLCLVGGEKGGIFGGNCSFLFFLYNCKFLRRLFVERG